MKSVAQKILISLGFITLIALSVIPVSVNAVTSLELCLTMANSAENPEGKTVEGCRAEEAARVAGGVVDPQANQKTKSLIPQLFDFAGGIMGAVFFPVFQIIMTMTAGLLGFSGLFLDYIIDLTVVKLADNLKNIAAINNTWKVIRDLANMSFIFILLYQGVRMVLGLGDGKSGVQNVVKNIIVAAILVNFSLFFTKVIIDASNIVTLGFYRSIVSSGTGEVIPGYETNFGLAGAFMKALRLSSLYKVNFFETWAATALSGAQGPLVFAGNTVFMLIATFVFLAVAVMFIIRYLSFIILLIMSPIAFVAMAIPGLNDLKEKYVKTLTSQALFAPVFMLLTWVMLTLAGDSGFLKSTVGGTLGDALTRPDGSTISLIVEYTLIIGLLIQTLVLSKSVATKAGFVTKDMVNKGTSFLGGAMFGGAAWAGRQTIGRRAASMAKDEDLQKRADQGDLGARMKLGAAKYVSKSSFDARRSFLGEKAASNMGIDMGKGMPFAPDAGKGGFAGVKADKKKETETKLDEITKRYKDKDDWNKLAEVFKERSDDDQKYIYKSLSAKERVGLDMAMGGPNANTKFRDKLNKEEKDKTEEETIKYYTKDKKWSELSTYLQSKGTTAEQIFIYDKLSARDRVAFDMALGNPVLTGTLRSGLSIEENEKTSKAEREFIKAKREQDKLDDLHKVATDPQYAASLTPAQIDNMVNKISPAQAKKLSEESLTDPLIVPRLTVRHLTEIGKDGLLDSAQIATMKTYATPAQLAWMNDPVRASNWI